MRRCGLLALALLFGLAETGTADRRSSPESRRLPYAKRSSRPSQSSEAWGTASVGAASVESYDCSHTQSGFIAVNPCTGNDITEEATVE